MCVTRGPAAAGASAVPQKAARVCVCVRVANIWKKYLEVWLKNKILLTLAFFAEDSDFVPELQWNEGYPPP